MKLCQVFVPGAGKRVGVVDPRGGVTDITAPGAEVRSVLDLIRLGRTPAGIDRLAARLARGKRPRFTLPALDVAPSPRRAHLLAPVDAPEIWGAGITYRRSADYYTAHEGRAKGIYDHVYESERPELFFKATMSRAVGSMSGPPTDIAYAVLPVAVATTIPSAQYTVNGCPSMHTSTWIARTCAPRATTTSFSARPSYTRSSPRVTVAWTNVRCSHS